MLQSRESTISVYLQLQFGYNFRIDTIPDEMQDHDRIFRRRIHLKAQRKSASFKRARKSGTTNFRSTREVSIISTICQ